MFEAVAFAFVVSVALVVAGKTVVPAHDPNPKAWKHIRGHDRVYYMHRPYRK